MWIEYKVGTPVLYVGALPVECSFAQPFEGEQYVEAFSVLPDLIVARPGLYYGDEIIPACLV